MRCKYCNTILTDKEACWKDYLGHYMDTCHSCMTVEGQYDSNYDPDYDEPVLDEIGDY